MKSRYGGLFSGAVFVFSIALAAAIAVGWILNIVKLIQTDFVPMTTMLIARVIGIFLVPLGAVLGFF